ncbi:MAG: ABC transporter permease [Deltaproteobacteria bacterium]|nr:ABC transporter permease [Deltaproteobacteria bacterium]MBI3388468.1 ABC transporter permease [Deltaproteobacteria bacterium]
MLLAIIRQALTTMRLHRRWAALTMFGIVWGTASVVLLVGWGVGVHGMVDRGMQKIGKNLVYVFPGRVGEDLSPAEERRTLNFKLADVQAVRTSARHAEVVSAEVLEWTYVRGAAAGRSVDVRGVEPTTQALRDSTLAAGRFILPDDIRYQRRVAVIGQTARERLLGPRPAVGARVSMDGQSFEIVGLLDRVGTQLSRNRTEIDEQIWIPITTAMTMTGREHVDLLMTRPTERRLNEVVKREVRTILARRLHVSPADEEAVFIASMVDILSGFDSVFAGLQVFLIVLAIGTLAIGGIGVMNMMLVSVNERRREIGLRLAVGALRRHVVGQFLIETLVITLLGGFTGLALGLGGCVLLGTLPRDVVPVPVIVPQVVGLALVVTTLVGVLSGSGPAWRAARVDPAESLRAE